MTQDLAPLLKLPHREVGGLGGTPARAIIEPQRDERGEHFRNRPNPVIKTLHRFETILLKQGIFEHDPRPDHPVHRFLELGEIDRCDTVARWSREDPELPGAEEGRNGHGFIFRGTFYQQVIDLFPNQYRTMKIVLLRN